MKVRKIVHDRWQVFFNDFNHLHHGKHVNVDKLGSQKRGAQPQVRDQPLVGIMTAGGPLEPHEWIEVITGDSPASQAAHCVAKPSQVWVAEEGGWMVALQIDSEDGSVTMLRTEPPREGMPCGFRIA